MDAVSAEGELYSEQIPMGAIQHSVGFLVKEDERCLAIARDLVDEDSEGQWDATLSIPKSIILERRELKAKD